ncbi:MAG TPA: SDR family NAD(P)-dependent oxidoreductase [Ktedonobacteraceae bacterium]|jgi:NAD(P)-dependent dehydrogenase (short-subunit alcohol dehydrogenase family)|nr:SDR family NAD(P)-dependent oxidoreductase [Ktedonobacteraceae bacterium]
MRLQGKAAIITGVSYKGQAGYALAQAFAREGADLVISARNEQRVKARAEELRAEGAKMVLPVAADLTTEEGAKDLIQAALGAYERVDILVNLAGGLTKIGPSDELSLADWQSELNNNLLTTYLCTRAVWSTMRSQGSGKILNFSRAGGIEGVGPHMIAYNCAKAGVDALTRTFAKEGEKLGIYVNAIGPGLLITETNLEAMKPSSEELSTGWVTLSQLAEVAIFLTSSASDGVNGVILPVKARSA